MTHSKTAQIRTAIAVIATLLYGRLHVRRSWGEADDRREGSATSPGACPGPQPEAASPGSRLR